VACALSACRDHPLPIAIIMSFIPLCGLGLTSNIMSLGGIAIAIGAMIDAAIIMVENAHKALEHFKEEHGHDPTGQERFEVIVDAAKSVGRPLFFSLLASFKIQAAIPSTRRT
jgi:Cu(I)/Ag(I) efflux system membrane protein CusA/SilA